MVGVKPVRLIGIIFFLYLVWQADFHSICSRWEKISWIYMVPLPLISGLMLTLRALRWRLLLNSQGAYLSPQITWGTSPQDVVAINGEVPDPENEKNPNRKKAMERSLEYMGLEPRQEIQKIKVDKVFIGSCTNGRIEDLREVAKVVKGKKVSVESMIVPGSGLVKKQAEDEGLDKIFTDAGFDWREPGCSMCLAMNPDQLKPKERCASTSNRNFEGRQGREGRTHLVSPAIAAASAIKGVFTTVEEL